MLMRAEREALVDYGKKLSLEGLCPGTSGNLSVYDPDSGLMAITPSGLNYFETCPEDIVITDLSGNIADGGRRPSSELNLHAAFYRAKPEASAPLSTRHSVFCTTLGRLGEPVRAVHFMIGAANSREIPLAPYVTFGTEELADDGGALLRRLRGRAAGESRARDLRRQPRGTPSSLPSRSNMSRSCNTAPAARGARTCWMTNRLTRR